MAETPDRCALLSVLANDRPTDQILILDGALVINKRAGVRHQAVKRLFYKAVIKLSGTLPHTSGITSLDTLIFFYLGIQFLPTRLSMRAF